MEGTETPPTKVARKLVSTMSIIETIHLKDDMLMSKRDNSVPCGKSWCSNAES